MNDKTRNRVWKWSLIGLFGMAALAMVAGGYWLYRHETQAIRSEKQIELKAIAELKAGQIAKWRNERVSDARVHSRRVFLRSAVGQWLKDLGDASLRTEAEENLESIRTSYGYENVIVADRDGRILFSLNPRLTVLEASAKHLVEQAISSRDAVFGDLFRCPACNQVHLDVAAPILDPDKQPVAALILRTDPEQFLYPFVQSWPTPSRSAETLLVRRDGDDVLFLNKLRHRPDPALTLHIPLSRADVPAVWAALGHTGEIEGRDNRGVQVLAEILPVPGSSWFMEAKVDADEIFAEARYRGRFILLFTALSVFVTGTMAAFVFSFRQKALYQNLYHAECQRRQVEEEIHATFYSIGDGVISTDAAGRVTRMNPVAEQLTGWREVDALDKPVEQVFHIVNEESRAKVENPVARVMRDGTIVNLANHTLLVARDGNERPIADSGAPIRDEKGQVTGAVLVFRDQTDERRAENRCRLDEARANTLLELSQMTDRSAAEITNHAMESAIKLTGSTIGYIAFANEDETILTMHYWSNSAMQQCAMIDKPIVYPVKDTGLWGEAIRQRKTVVTNDYAAPNPLKKGVPAGHVRLTRHLSIPVFDGGRIVAVAGIGNKAEDYHDDDVRQLTLFMDGMWRILCRKRAEEALRESENRFRAMFEGSRDGILAADMTTKKFVFGNKAIQQMLGCTPEELIALRVSDIHPQNDLPATFEAFAALATGETQLAHDLPVQRKDGSVFCADINAFPLDVGGKHLLVGVFRDVTERKRAEQIQGHRTAILEQLASDVSLSEILNAIVLAMEKESPSSICSILLMDPSGRHLLHGAAPGLPDFYNRAVNGLEIGEGVGSCGTAAATGKRVIVDDVQTHPYWAPFRELTKSAGLASCWSEPILTQDGRVLGTFAIYRREPAVPDENDLWLIRFASANARLAIERKQAEEEIQGYTVTLESANKRLEESTRAADAATRAKSEFLANMSHEIRTPMTSILGYSDLLMDDSLGAADRKTFLTTVRRNGEHLLQLINDILDLSKIESGKMVMDLGPCHLPSTVADVASMMRPRAEQHRSTLEVRYTGSLPETIHTDGTKLRQVIVNLVGNAVKFTENGSIRIGVSFLPQWRSDQSAVSVEVTDTGIGIRQEALARLFEPFAQAESSTTRKYGGTGLGLAISRHIVTALGGELTVRSTPGEGSTFTVTVPTGDISGVNLLQSPGEVICEDETGTQWTPGAGVLRGVRILLAEDSIDNQELLRTVLGNVGAEVEIVENGRLAIERAETGTFDVVLMDMNMPEMDGYEATRRLRDGGYQRPILALTANAMTGDAEHCLAAGCDAHLAKPIDRKQLIETVAQYAMSNNGQTDAPTACPSRAVTPGQNEGILSKFADDPQLAGILPGFVERLPHQLDALCEALEEERLEDAERLAHRLKGAGGSYGYPTLSEVAGSLELAAKAQNMDGSTAALAEVKEICAAILTGWTGDLPEASRP